jgi:hypothetical protein
VINYNNTSNLFKNLLKIAYLNLYIIYILVSVIGSLKVLEIILFSIYIILKLIVLRILKSVFIYFYKGFKTYNKLYNIILIFLNVESIVSFLNVYL